MGGRGGGSGMRAGGGGDDVPSHSLKAQTSR